MGFVRVVWAWCLGVWDILHTPGSPEIAISLVFALGALLVTFVIVNRQFKERLKEKDIRIEELVRERNEFKDLLFEAKGIRTRSTKKKSS